MRFVEACCMVTKLMFPEAQDIIGIATESGRTAEGSEDALYYDARGWTEAERAEAESLQRDLNLLTQVTRVEGTEKEYPDVSPASMSRPVFNTQPIIGIPRKQPCPCGSGKKYKRCCGDDRRQRKRQRRSGLGG